MAIVTVRNQYGEFQYQQTELEVLVSKVASKLGITFSDMIPSCDLTEVYLERKDTPNVPSPVVHYKRRPSDAQFSGHGRSQMVGYTNRDYWDLYGSEPEFEIASIDIAQEHFVAQFTSNSKIASVTIIPSKSPARIEPLARVLDGINFESLRTTYNIKWEGHVRIEFSRKEGVLAFLKNYFDV